MADFKWGWVISGVLVQVQVQVIRSALDSETCHIPCLLSQIYNRHVHIWEPSCWFLGLWGKSCHSGEGQYEVLKLSLFASPSQESNTKLHYTLADIIATLSELRDLTVVASIIFTFNSLTKTGKILEDHGQLPSLKQSAHLQLARCGIFIRCISHLSPPGRKGNASQASSS